METTILWVVGAVAWLAVGWLLARSYYLDTVDLFQTPDGQDYDLTEVIVALRAAAVRILKRKDIETAESDVDMICIQLLREAKALLAQKSI